MKLVHVSGFLDYLSPAIQDLVAVADIIIFQRNIVSKQAFDAMRYWQGMGKPVLIDLDDAYHVLPWSNPAHKFWLEREDAAALQMLERGLKQSNGLVAPNRLLLYDWSNVCDGYYLQNYADGDFWAEIPPRETMKEEAGLEDKLVIGWGGSVSHYDGWWGSGLREAAERITKRYPEVVWMLCGNDHRIYDQLDVPKYNKYLQQGVPPDYWPKIVRTFDIGLAPLFGPYDQRRSWLKGLEYQLAGVPWVATKGEPYRDFEERGLGYHVLNGVDEWEETLEGIIKNLSEEQAQAETMIPMSKQWLAENQADRIKEVYGTAIKKFTGGRPTTTLPGVIRVTRRTAETVGAAEVAPQAA